MINPKDFQQKYTTTLKITGRKDSLVALKSQLDIQQCKVEVIKKMEKVSDENERYNEACRESQKGNE